MSLRTISDISLSFSFSQPLTSLCVSAECVCFSSTSLTTGVTSPCRGIRFSSVLVNSNVVSCLLHFTSTTSNSRCWTHRAHARPSDKTSYKTATVVDADDHGSHVLFLELILLVLLILVRPLRGILDRGVSTLDFFFFQSKGVSSRIAVVVLSILDLDLRSDFHSGLIINDHVPLNFSWSL